MLVAHDLAARRGDSVLWRGLDFTVSEGHALVVRGANGSGKTTLLRVLAGLTHAEHGDVQWRGRQVGPMAQALRDDLVFIGHAPALKDELTAFENLASLVALAAQRVSAQQVGDALAALGLSRQSSLPARVLSQGQRRRVHLAKLALTRRPLWILDEPATALDAEGLEWLAATLSAQLARGGVVVTATHVPLPLDADRMTEVVL